MLHDAGAHRSRDEKDLIELVLVQMNTDECKGPRERLDTMFESIWNAPVIKPRQHTFFCLLRAPRKLFAFPTIPR